MVAARRSTRPSWVGMLAAAVLAGGCGGAATAPRASAPAAISTGMPRTPADSPTPVAVPSLTPLATPVPAASLCSVAPALSSWSVARLAAQLVVVPADENDVSGVAAAVDQGAGGVILFGSQAPQDLGRQIQALVAGSPQGVGPLVMTDEEGGTVQRMANLVTPLPWAATMSVTMSPAAVSQLAEQVAQQMRADGITMDLAPVLDLASGPGPDALHTDGPRSFGLDPEVATSYGLAFAQGLEAGGVVPVVKHFPGEGDASGNTDDGPASTPPLAQLESSDLRPFEAAINAGLPAVMVGDASVPGLSQGPASLSSAAIVGLLRQQLGFNGLVITDSLSAEAISALHLSVPQAAVESIAAGADMVLFQSTDPDGTFQQVVQALVNAVSDNQISGSVLDAAVEQVLTAKGEGICP